MAALEYCNYMPAKIYVDASGVVRAEREMRLKK